MSILPLLARWRRAAPWLIACGLCAPAVAQARFIVDAANGPGTHFTTIAAAVAAVPDGSIIEVRPGGYDAFSISAKGLTLLGGTGVYLTARAPWSGYEITDTQPGQNVVMRGFTFSDFYPSLTIQRCCGAVVLEEVRRGVTYCACVANPPATFSITASVQVHFRECDAWQVIANGSNIVFERCALIGYGAVCGLGTCTRTFPALSASGGTTQLVDCTLDGGDGGGGSGFYPVVPNQPAIVLVGGTLRILAPGRVTAGQSSVSPAVPAIGGSGDLHVDPSVIIQASASPAIAPSVSTQTIAMPALLGLSANPGGSLAASVHGPTGALVYLVVGWPGAPLQWPGLAYPFWIDPVAFWIAATGVPQPGSPVQVAIAVPNDPSLRGARVGWQALSADAQGLQVSNPTSALVR